MIESIGTTQTLQDLRLRHIELIEKVRLPYFIGCRLKILLVADSFIYFNDENFGLSELISTLRGMSTLLYPVSVDLAHRGDPGTARLAGGQPGFVFDYARLKQYHQLWIMAAETRDFTPISDAERQAIRRFMDEGGGVFATGDHEDLGVSVGGYIPRVRAMRKWFWPNPGPQGEPVAPHGSDATRHDTNREGHDAGFSFNDQSDDVPQRITPHYFGTGFIRSVHPVLCTSSGPIRVLPDHAHEGECIVPANLGANYTIGNDSFREFPDGPDGNPLAPQVIATSTMISGAAVPEFGKPPVPGGRFGAIGAWDGHRAGSFGRIVVDATWHHFININLIGDRGLGLPDPAIPKTMGFLHSVSGAAHYDRIKSYFRNIANWLTPRSMRRCLMHRQLWLAANDGIVLENLRRSDLVATGLLVLDRLQLVSPCQRLMLLDDLHVELPLQIRELIDPFAGGKRLAELADLSMEADIERFSRELTAAVAGGVALQMFDSGLTPEALKRKAGEEEPEVPELVVAADKGIAMALEALRTRFNKRSDVVRKLFAEL
jgi:hypothetical protein